MRIRTIITTAAAPAALAAILLGTAGQAANAAVLTSAHQAKPVEAITKIVARPDSGGAGTWAFDGLSAKAPMTRTADVFYLGKSTDPALATTPYMYWGQLKDVGTFRNLPGQLAPNQGGKHAGQLMRLGQVSGPMAGTAQFGLFYASAKAHNGLAPTFLKGTVNASYPTSSWLVNLFPAGTTFSGMALTTWDWQYHAVPKVKVVNGHKVTVYTQNWDDGSYNLGGQTPRAGQIVGVR